MLEFDEVYPFNEKSTIWWLAFTRWQRSAVPSDVSHAYPEGGVGYLYDNHWAIKWSPEQNAYVLELEKWRFVNTDLTTLEKYLFAYIVGEYEQYLERWAGQLQ